MHLLVQRTWISTTYRCGAVCLVSHGWCTVQPMHGLCVLAALRLIKS